MKPGINIPNLRNILILSLTAWACLLTLCLFVVAPVVEVMR